MPKGSIRLKRPPDYWELRVYAGRDPTTNQRKYVSRTFRGGKRDANKELALLVAKVSVTGPQTDVTVDQLLTAHVDHLAARGRESRTIDGYRSIARAISSDPIGSRPAKRVGVKTVDDFYNRLLGRGLAPATIQRYHTLLGAAFKQGISWGWISQNTPRLATPPAVNRMPRTIPTAEVVNAILNQAETSRNPENFIAFRLLALTGARRGEVCGLRWSQVDLVKRRFTIREAVAQLADGSLESKDPKSHQMREVAIDEATTELLAEHKADQVRYAAAAGSNLATDAFVLADLRRDPTGGTAIQPNRLTQAFRRIADRVEGAGAVRLHDLRHWFASTQIDSGEPLPAVAARIGDNVETLAKVYAHKGQRGDDEAVANLSHLLD